MPADLPVTFVLWRDAKADPPKAGTRVLVDRANPLPRPVFAYRSTLDNKYKMWSDPHDTLDPQPTVWCDPRPPVESEIGTLTMDHLRLAEHALTKLGEARHLDAAARLRHAIESVEP